MGYNPQGHKELDTTERLTLLNYVGMERGWETLPEVVFVWSSLPTCQGGSCSMEKVAEVPQL